MKSEPNIGKRRAKSISVVVLSKDEPDLEVSLGLLQSQCESSGAQCIVVDASEGRLESIRLMHPWVEWIDYTGPFWRSSTIPHQRNVGCRAATGDVIAFCDSGAEPQEDWLKTLCSPLLDGNFALVCGPVYAKKAGAFTLINDAADGEIVDSAPTGNMAFLKSVFDEVGGFDERLFYGSDVDFTWRCANAGHPCYQVREARMLMDFGSSSLSLRRSWRYGRGWSRLYSSHPDRHFWMIKKSPERVAYPLWILLGLFIPFTRNGRNLKWVAAAWIGILGLFVTRNRKESNTRAVIADHVVGGASVINETLRGLSGEMPPVVFLPDDPAPYLQSLSEALQRQGTPVGYWRGPTKSATLNILLGPLWAIVLAWRGVKVIHIHWTYSFSRSSRSLSGRLARWWFGIFLNVAHVAGLKVVWTAHNVMPHEAVFDDDAAARRLLVTSADAVISLSQYVAEEVSAQYGASKVAVIPHGPLEMSEKSRSRESARRDFNLDRRPCFTFFGNLRAYKGLETLIAAAELLGSEVSVRIAGRGDAAYSERLSASIEEANTAGADVQMISRWLENAELADLLAATDVCVFPFVLIDNSSSVLLALTAGLPVIIPNTPSLQHIDNDAVYRFDSINPVCSLRDVMALMANMDGEQLSTSGAAGRQWALGFNWDEIANQTADVYAQIIRGK